VVLALAESVAIQSVTLALEASREPNASWRGLFARLRPEAITGLMLGLAAGVLVGGLAAVWQRLTPLFAIVVGGIAVGVTCAAVAGLAVPHVLRLLKRDPQVAAGPIALTCADVAALLAYFNLARLLT
jgi:magnesium transporter